MGGFRLRCTEEMKKEYDLKFHYKALDGWVGAVTAPAFIRLLDDGVITFPVVDAEALTDRGKRDGFLKLFTILQLLWFFIQIFARLISHLEVTLIEITTTALVTNSIFMYCFWLNKPFNASTPEYLRHSQCHRDPSCSCNLVAAHVSASERRTRPLPEAGPASLSHGRDDFTKASAHNAMKHIISDLRESVPEAFWRRKSPVPSMDLPQSSSPVPSHNETTRTREVQSVPQETSHDLDTERFGVTRRPSTLPRQSSVVSLPRRASSALSSRASTAMPFPQRVLSRVSTSMSLRRAPTGMSLQHTSSALFSRTSTPTLWSKIKLILRLNILFLAIVPIACAIVILAFSAGIVFLVAVLVLVAIASFPVYLAEVISHMPLFSIILDVKPYIPETAGPPNHIASDDETNKQISFERKAMTMFYVEEYDDVYFATILIGVIFGIIFGSIHFCALGSPFPSRGEYITWIIASSNTVLAPSVGITISWTWARLSKFVVYLTGWVGRFLRGITEWLWKQIDETGNWFNRSSQDVLVQRTKNWINDIVRRLVDELPEKPIQWWDEWFKRDKGPADSFKDNFYILIVSRICIIGLSIASLRSLSDSARSTVSWIDHIPHV